jgi:hypothetical protein
MNIKDTSLIGARVEKWDSYAEKLEKLDESVKALKDKIIEVHKDLTQLARQERREQQQEKQGKPSVVNSIKVDLGAEYNCYLTNIFVIYQARKGSPTEPVFFADAEGDSQLLEWHEFYDFYREYAFTVIEDRAGN